MPEQNKKIISKYQGEKNPDKRYLKLGRMITDDLGHKLKGVTSDDPEYWGLREVLTPEMCEIALKMKLRQYYTLAELMKIHKNVEPKHLEELLEEMSYIGILEYDYGDNYDHDGELKDRPRVKRYRVPYYVPGSAELFNSTQARIDKNPAVASFFERMTFVPIAPLTKFLPPGGGGVGMHVIPVEKAIEAENESVDLEHISYWLKKYDGHIAAGICSCRASRAVLGDGCTDDPEDWCIQLGDMADFAVETGRAHYIDKEEALRILEFAEKNGYVHQITNIDGENKIFDICNCNVKICNALRTSLLFNTPYLSRSAYTAKVTKENCVACGKCVESCPAGAVKLGQKMCHKDGSEVKYPEAPLPDNNFWGEYMWDEEYRDTARASNTWDSGSAPCKAACPAHIPVQGYLRMARDGRYEEAIALIKTENPFPSVCGRICNKMCEQECTRGDIDGAVSVDAVKKFLADLDRKSGHPSMPEKLTQSLRHKEYDDKIAIIGGGPAGLSAAYYLAKRGYHPTVFEKNPKAGGMLMYGVPTYKLEKDVVDDEIRIIENMGVTIRTGVEVGRDVTIDELKKQGYKAFYIAIGCQGGKRPGVANDTAPGTDIAVHYLREALGNPESRIEGDVVVVGGGNVAIDCARNAKRRGASSVTMLCLESDEEMPATKSEIAEAREEGVEIEASWGPKEITVDESGHVNGIVFKRCASVFDSDGKFSPKFDERKTVTKKADHIIFAIGQDIEWGALLDGKDVKYWHGKYPVADKFTFQTDDPDIFVGGDVFTGPRFAINAIAAGHDAAESLHRHVRPKASMTIGRDRRNFTPLNKKDLTYPSYDEAGRQEEPVDESIDEMSFRDRHGTLTEEQVHIETSRCLSCGAAHVDPHKCIGCGICTTRCQFDAIHLVRDMPECTTMVAGEDRMKSVFGYMAKRAGNIIRHMGSEESKEIRKKRKAWKKASKA